MSHDSTLALTYDAIRKRIGDYRGYRTDFTAWSAQESELVEMIVAAGCRKFYVQSGHEWSFLKPVATLLLKAGITEVALPEDFGFLTGTELYFSTTENKSWTVKVQHDAKILYWRQASPDSTGAPTYAAVVPGDPPGRTGGQRSKLLLWPETDAAYTMTFRYSVLPDALGPAVPYPHGGAAHAQTLLEACLSASEQQDGMIGLYTQMYPQSLQQSIEYDRRVKPQTLGREGFARRLGGDESDFTATYVPTL